MRRRILIAIPVLLGALWVGAQIARQQLARLTAEAVHEQADLYGIEVDWRGLSVGLTGRIEFDRVVLRHEALGQVIVPRATLSIDLVEAVGGALHFSEVVLERPRLQLSRALLEPLCTQTGLCATGSASRSAGGGEALSQAELARLLQDLAGQAPGTGSGVADVPFDRLRVDGLQMEILSERSQAPYLAVYHVDMLVEPRAGALHLSGVGRLVSVFLRDEDVPFSMAGSMSAANLGLEVALPESLEVDTPAGSLSFDEFTVSVGAQTDVRLGKVVVLPRLLDVTQAWQADSVAATLSLRSGIVPEAVVVEGLKGELDLVALSDLAAWLAADAASDLADELDPDIAELRSALNFGLTEVRGLLYGAAVSVSSAAGDVRLTYRDGSTLSLARLDLDIGQDAGDGSTQLRVTYEGQAELPERWLGLTAGYLEIPIRSLTAGRIAGWTE